MRVEARLLANHKFTGKERDIESGLNNFGARYNSSSFGRFLSPDATPNGVAIGDPQSWNLYTYVRNQPTNSVDRTGDWATYIHADITTAALEGYISGGELKQLVNEQYVMDRDQDRADQYKHAMRDVNQSAEDANQQTLDFVNYNLAGAAKELNSDGSLSTDALTMLGDAIHTLQDMTSPMHESPSGTPLPWYGVGFLGLSGLRHFGGESQMSDSWAGIGRAVRLTMAAFMLTDPEQASKHGLNKWTFDRQANERISHLVEMYDLLDPSITVLEEDEDRLCALGNPAACRR